MSTKATKTPNKSTTDARRYRRLRKEIFPSAGKMRVPQLSACLGIRTSIWWLCVTILRVLLMYLAQ